MVKLHRLIHSTRDVLNLVHDLEQKGAGLRVLEPDFSTSTDTRRILVTVLGIVSRNGAPVHSRRVGDRGRQAQGKPPLSIDASRVRELKTQGLAGATAIAKALGVGRASVYRVLREGSI